MSPPRLILLGVFGAPQGVRGEIRVKSFAQEPVAIACYGALTDKIGKRAFAMESVRALKDDMVVVRLAGIATREAAQALTGVELYARREQLPPPREEEFYHDDLIGLRAVTPEEAPLGRVVALYNFGAGDILEIAPEGGDETLLLPFTKAVAVEIDFAKARIVIVAPNEIDGDEKDGG